MLTASLTSQGIRIDVLSHPGEHHPMQDRWIVHEQPASIRAGVIDGCTPWETEPYPGADAAAWAAQTLAQHCGLNLTLEEAVKATHTSLYNPAITPSRRQAMTVAGLVDCTIERGKIDYSGIVVGDCELWSLQAENATPLLIAGGQNVTPTALAAWMSHDSSQETLEQRRTREAEAFDKEDTWERPALGRFPQPRYTRVEGRAEAVILASDGARLKEAFAQGLSARELDQWLIAESQQPDRDDITYMRIAAAN